MKYTYQTEWVGAHRGASWNIYRDGVWIAGGHNVTGIYSGTPEEYRVADLSRARAICRERIADLKQVDSLRRQAA